MAFCNFCGATVESGARFCPKCGAGQPGGPLSTTSPGTTAPPPQGGNALKLILIVVVGLVVVGVVILATIAFVGWHIARQTRVVTRNGNVRIESPLGNIATTNNPEDAARNLGIDLYPGATLQKDNAANVNVAGMHTVAAEFETDDPPDKVADFYKSKFPDAKFSVNGQDEYSIVSTGARNLITINITSQGGKTVISVANVSGKGVTGGASD